MKFVRSIVFGAAMLLGQSAVAGGFGDLLLSLPVTEEMTGEEVDEAIMSQSIEQGISRVNLPSIPPTLQGIGGPRCE